MNDGHEAERLGETRTVTVNMLAGRRSGGIYSRFALALPVLVLSIRSTRGNLHPPTQKERESVSRQCRGSLQR
jgi:hypothetical protein